MNIILFDDEHRDNLLPLAFTRPVAKFRIGILTIQEKWEKLLPGVYSHAIQGYLQKKFPVNFSEQNLFINGSILPDDNLVNEIKKLKPGQALHKGKVLIGTLLNQKEIVESNDSMEYNADLIQVKSLADIFSLNDFALRSDYKLLTSGRTSAKINDSNTVLGNEVFVEEGAQISCAILNSNSGPIYIDKDAEILEGSMIRGPFYLGEHSVVKMGAKIYGATTIGPHSKVGGEIQNAVIFGYSNKGHDGYLGNSVLGEWCNIGADSNNSNLKNNYAEVKLWNYPQSSFKKTGLQFCGLIMADHAKCGINTMFNTGTVVGVCCNIFGSGFPRNFVPDFSWGGAHGFEVFSINKAFEVAEKVFERRSLPFNEMEKEILTSIFDQTEKFRKY